MAYFNNIKDNINKNMRLIITGDKRILDYDYVVRAIHYFQKKKEYSISNIDEIISNKSCGVSELAELFAENNNKIVRHFFADWNNLYGQRSKIRFGKVGMYNKMAGIERDCKMAAYSDAALIINNYEETNKQLINEMRRIGKPVFIYNKRMSLRRLKKRSKKI